MPRRLAILAALAPALLLAPAAGADLGATQVVQGRVTAQFGAAVLPDGTVSASPSTIPVSVTHTVEHGVEVVTIAPLR